MSDLALVVRRVIAAPVERVFAAWTEAEQLRRWWGPAGVHCPHAEIDLRVGGAYRIANALPDGSTVWINGAFEEVAPPHRLVYSWSTTGEQPPVERVTVRFETHAEGTEVVVVHERIATAAARTQHELGWCGCLDGLGALFAGI